MPCNRVILLSNALYNRLKGRFGELRCFIKDCGRELKIGDLIVSHRASGHHGLLRRVTKYDDQKVSKTRHYCIYCALRFHMVVEKEVASLLSGSASGVR